MTMSPTATADVAGMIFTLLAREAPPGVYHAVNSGTATWYEFAHEIIARASVNADVVPIASAQFPTVAVRPAYSVLSNVKTATIVGAIPHWSGALDRYLCEKGHTPSAIARVDVSPNG